MDGKPNKPPLQIKYEEFMRILAALKEANWDYARIQLGDLNLIVSNGEVDVPEVNVARTLDRTIEAAVEGGTPARVPEDLKAPVPASTHQHTDALANDGTVSVPSPSIGTFWRSPQPGAPPFVDLGSVVEADQTLCIVEVMKLLMHVTTPVSGRVDKIHKQNGELVEYGETLFSILPTAS